ncbi:MAG: histidine kinase [Bacteroidales bacterium]|nr:histidine kinase [Bacteroidales bacterium]
MNKIFFIFILLILQLQGASQLQRHASRHEIDSLKNNIHGSGIKERILILNQLAGCYASLSFDTSFFYGGQALHLSRTVSDSLSEAIIKVNIGNAYYYKMDFRNAVLTYLSATRRLEEHKKWKELGEIYFQLGQINFFIMRSDECISFYRKAIHYYQLSGDEGPLATVWENMAIAFNLISYWPVDSSLVYGHKLLDYSRRINDPYWQAMALTEIAMYYIESKTVAGKQMVISYSDSALYLAEKLKNEKIITIIFNNLGSNYDRSSPLFDSTGNLALARYYYEKGISHARKSGEIIFQIMIHNALAAIDIEENKNYQAERNLDSGEIKLVEFFQSDLKSNVLIENLFRFREEPFNFFIAQRERNNFFKNRYRLAVARGELRQAIDYLQRYYQSRDSMNSALKTRQIELMIAEAESERTEQKILSLSKNNEFERLKLSRSRYIFIGISAGVIIISLLVLLYFQRKRWKAEQRSSTLEQKLLRSQMNPHFIFNSLAGIQNFIVNRKTNEASIYLSRFSQLVRNILDNSIEEYVSLQKEIETIRCYLELQQLRYAGQFTYNLSVDEKIEEENMMIPPMLAQPFIENSIEHGIRYKETPGHLDIRFLLADSMIRFEVEDDGVGREKAMEIELKQNRVHRSLSTSITHDRLVRLNKKLKNKIRLEITDLKDNHGEACGTRVSFGIPVVEK